MKFAKFLRTPVFTEHPWWLLLKDESNLLRNLKESELRIVIADGGTGIDQKDDTKGTSLIFLGIIPCLGVFMI